MMKSYFGVMAVVLCCYLCSCNMINPVEKVPTYIHLDSIKVTTTEPSRTGTTSSNITSAWVYQDNNLIGIFGVPSNIPIPLDNDAIIRIAGGVALDGLQGLQDQYPFYTSDTMTLKKAPGQVIRHTAKVQYSAASKIQIVCDFETGNTFRKVNEDNTSDTTIVRTSDKSKIFEGGGAGYIYLDASHSTSENINSPDNSFPIPLGKSYIEINYKSSVEFQVGLQGTVNGDPVYQYPVYIKPSDSWNKMYIGLESIVGTYQSSVYRVMIKAKLGEGQTDGYVLVDNIKIVSY